MSSPDEIAGFDGANKAPAWTGRRDFEALSGPPDGVSMKPQQATGDPMAYNSGVQLAGLAGIVGGGLGAYFGYNYAIAESMPPVQGALILGAVGMIAFSAGAFVLKSAMQFVVYVIMFGLVVYIFRDTIEGLTGINPVDAVYRTMAGWGIPLPPPPE
jgi:hypothetical protein